MSATDSMRWMGRSARHRAETIGQSMKGRALERRLMRTSDEAERLRIENQMLREEVDRERDDHRKMMDMLERRLEPPEIEVEVEQEKKKTHRGRWFLFLTALGGGAYAVVKMRAQGNGESGWDETGGPAATQRTSST